jgi:hypothetical protein
LRVFFFGLCTSSSGNLICSCPHLTVGWDIWLVLLDPLSVTGAVTGSALSNGPNRESPTPQLCTETSGFRNICFSRNTGRWMRSKNAVTAGGLHHRRNLFCLRTPRCNFNNGEADALCSRGGVISCRLTQHSTAAAEDVSRSAPRCYFRNSSDRNS